MADILDQNEVDALLKGVDSGDVETETDQPSLDAEDLSYDLTDPGRVIRDKMLSLPVVHDKFIKLFQGSLTALLRKDVDVQIINFEVMKYTRFIETIPLPASLSIISVKPGSGVMIFEMDAKIVFRLMDIFCGGTGTSRFKVEGRDFTAIEQRIIEKIVAQAIKDLMVAWQPVVPLKISLFKTEINPRFVRAVDKNDTLVVYTFEVDIDQVTCTMKLCIPYSTIEPFRVELSGEMVHEKILRQNQAQNEILKKNLKEMVIEVEVEVGEGETTFRDLMNLQVGDVITIGRRLDSPFDVKCEGVKKFRGFPGQSRGKSAVQIVSSVEKGRC